MMMTMILKPSTISVLVLIAMQALMPSPSSAAALPGRVSMCDGPGEDPDSEDMWTRYWGDVISWNYNLSALERNGNITWDDILYDTRFAMRFWSSNTNLQFVYRPDDSNADIMIGFYAGYHAPCRKQFDGDGYTLAHAYLPGPGKGGDIHLDADEFWIEHSKYLTITENLGTHDVSSVVSLYATLLHEIGHSLGFRHNKVLNSIMGEQLIQIRKNHTMSYYDQTLLRLIYGKPDKPADDRFVAKAAITTTTKSPLITTPPSPPPTTTASPLILTSQTLVSTEDDEPNESRFTKHNNTDGGGGDDATDADDDDDDDDDDDEEDDTNDENDGDRGDDGESEGATPTPETPKREIPTPVTPPPTTSPRFVAPKARMHFLANREGQNATDTLQSVFVNGHVMLFKNGYVWRCVLREDGAIIKTNPQYIEKEFHIQYARLQSIDHIYSPFYGMINMIDRDKLWRFYEQSIAPGYPKSLTSMGLPQGLPYGTRFMPDATRHITYIQTPNDGMYVFDEDRNTVRATIF